MAQEIKTVSIRLNRTLGKASIEHFRGAPIRFSLSLPDGTWDGSIEARVEVHSQRNQTGQTPLAAVSLAAPTGTTINADFSSASMMLSLGGESRKSFWVLVRATWPESVEGHGPDIDVYHLGALDLIAQPSSDVEVTPDPLNPLAPLSLVEALGDAVAESATSSALAAEIDARESADAAMQLDLDAKIPVTDIGQTVAPVQDGVIPPQYLGTLILDGGYVLDGLFQPSKILDGGSLA